ncbi:MAG: dCTP deaminase [Candidatus Eremiobacterota bacterium]
MSILTTTEIIEEIEKGRIKIEPFSKEMVGPASVDLTLSNAFRLFVRLPMHIRAIDNIDYKCATKGIWIPDGGCITIHPGDTLLGMTKEKITLPEDICGWLEGRSKFARVGLLVHISASFMQSGISNHQVLEMSNFGPIPIDMYPGTSVCQFIFQKTRGKAVYTGQFRLQTPEDFCKD